MSRVPSGPQTSSGTFRSGAADHGVSIRSGTPMTWSECRCVRNSFVTAFIWKAGLDQTLHEPAPRIEQQAFAAGLHERADPGFVDKRTRSARGSQQGDANVLRGYGASPLRGGQRHGRAPQAQEQHAAGNPGSQGHTCPPHEAHIVAERKKRAISTVRASRVSPPVAGLQLASRSVAALLRTRAPRHSFVAANLMMASNT